MATERADAQGLDGSVDTTTMGEAINGQRSSRPLIATESPCGAAARSMWALIEACAGEMPASMHDTPERVVRAFQEMTAGYREDIPALIKRFELDDRRWSNTAEEVPAARWVCFTGLRFVSVCEHHLMPFVGQASLAYIPQVGEDGTARVIGASKAARLVEAFAKRFQLQERMTDQITHALYTHVSKHVAVRVVARHACMGCRGVRQPDADMVTSNATGVFARDSLWASKFEAVVGR